MPFRQQLPVSPFPLIPRKNMSIVWLTVLVLVVGLVTFGLSGRLVIVARMAAACTLMMILAASILFVQNMEKIGRDFAIVRPLSFLFGDRTKNLPNPAPDSEPGLNFALQAISREDHLFLDELLRKLNEDAQPQGKSVPGQNIRRTGIVGSGDESLLKAELAINSAEIKRVEAGSRKETVKRAQLVRPRHR
jgi:hypothetical protein